MLCLWFHLAPWRTGTLAMLQFISFYFFMLETSHEWETFIRGIGCYG